MVVINTAEHAKALCTIISQRLAIAKAAVLMRVNGDPGYMG
jgi:hypothetical protein